VQSRQVGLCPAWRLFVCRLGEVSGWETVDFGFAQAVEHFFFDTADAADAISDDAKQKDDEAEDEGGAPHRQRLVVGCNQPKVAPHVDVGGAPQQDDPNQQEG